MMKHEVCLRSYTPASFRLQHSDPNPVKKHGLPPSNDQLGGNLVSGYSQTIVWQRVEFTSSDSRPLEENPKSKSHCSW